MQRRDDDGLKPESGRRVAITPERWSLLKDIFFVALESEPSERAAIIAERCGSDRALRSELESFIRVHEKLQERDGASALRNENLGSLGAGRFVLQSKLGEGGFGTVYKAFDRKLQRFLAVKVLRVADTDSVSRFKREFRAIADLRLPNLVRSFELFSDQGTAFFTMELVDGESLLAYLRRNGVSYPSDEPHHARVASFDEVYRVFEQLSQGVRDLHASGWLHGDLKPSNVIVGRDGRVIILDLGLTKSLCEAVHTSRVWGSPSYMAPELFEGAAAAEPSDWYSVGVMLYEVLTGRLPREGTWVKLLADVDTAPPSPRVVLPGIPHHLDELCAQLLNPVPTQRPSGDEVLRCLGNVERRGLVRAGPQVRPVRAAFVGRAKQLAVLREALSDCAKGSASIVAIQGVSGIGKTALVRRFLQLLREEDGEHVVILEGRCFEHESIPYRAFDGVIESLGRYLKRLPIDQAERLLPRSVHELRRVFPALQQAREIRYAPRRKFDAEAEGVELRTKAFDALRELFGRIAHERPLVVVIDDLHWGDRDSAALLRHLMSSVDAPPMLLVVTYRAEFSCDAFLSELRKLSNDSATVLRELPVAELERAETEQLATLLLGERHASIPVVIEESAGIPFFVDELASRARMGGDDNATCMPRILNLDEVLLSRIARLSHGARRLLEVLSIARKPLRRAVAHVASALGAGAYEVEESLFVGHLARPCRDGEFLEPYHDRIRETVEAAMSADERCGLHYRIAQALEAHSHVDSEDLAMHYEAAGDCEHTAHFAILAAAEASKQAAFNRAAALYALALRFTPPDNREDTANLLVKLGDAQANAGYGREAAESYQAAAGLDPAESPELNRRAAEQLLRIGNVDHGLSVMAHQVKSGDWQRQRSQVLMLGWALARMAWLRLRGLGFRPRTENEIPKNQLLGVDMARTALLGLCIIDPVRALCIQSHHILSALRIGESSRVALALAAEAAFASLIGNARRTHTLIDAANAALQTSQAPRLRGSIGIAKIFSAFYSGKWVACRKAVDETARILSEECTGVHWELAVVHAIGVGALIASGELRECSRRLTEFARDAKERGDLLAEALLELLGVSHIVRLAQNQPEQVVDDLQELGRRLPPKRFPVVGYSMCFGLAEAALYMDEPGGAESFLELGSAKLKQALLHYHSLTRIQCRHLRARSAIMLAQRKTSQRDALLKIATAERRALLTERDTRAHGFASLIEAALAALAGDRQSTITALASSETQLQSMGMGGYAMIARWLRGRLLSSLDGRSLVQAAESWAVLQGLKRLDRMAATFAPGVMIS